MQKHPSASEALEAAVIYVWLQDGAFYKKFSKESRNYEDLMAYILGFADETPKTPLWAARCCDLDADEIWAYARNLPVTKKSLLPMQSLSRFGILEK
jgi:anaerobic selenocysteine-containing dehydrogenase